MTRRGAHAVPDLVARARRGELLAVLSAATTLDAPGFLNLIQNNTIGKSGGFLLVSPKEQLFVAASEAALRLQPIPWGKPDAKLGRVLCEHMVSANPPTVITWGTHQSRVRKLMRHYRLHDARIDDIDRLVLYQTKVNRLHSE